jgi:hypothetical protein
MLTAQNGEPMPVRLSASAARIVVIAALHAAACGGHVAGPTSPGGGPSTGSQGDVLAVHVSCPASLLTGQSAPCVAVARLRTGQMPLVSFEATWSSAQPEVVDVDATGIVHGRSAGLALVSASYRGLAGSAPVVVTAEDALRIVAAAEQGEFRPGTTATMWLQGYYSVASADSGRLSLRISDQNDTIATTAPSTVGRGGDFFLLSLTFVVPEGSTQVCRTAMRAVLGFCVRVRGAMEWGMAGAGPSPSFNGSAAPRI